MAQRVLDIDLDVFVDPRPFGRVKDGRLSSTDYRAWTPDEVVEYLEQRCGLRRSHPLPGKVVKYHHQVFDFWRDLIANESLKPPFILTHIDSHADMGMGDPSAGYIMCELLHKRVSERQYPKHGENGLLEGNYVSFALACRWISELQYVQHPMTRNRNHGGMPDIADSYFKDNNPNDSIIQLKVYPPECDNGITRLKEYTPIAVEPEVPIHYSNRDDFATSDVFSFLFVAESPNYTPAEIDRLIPVIEKYIDPIV